MTGAIRNWETQVGVVAGDNPGLGDAGVSARLTTSPETIRNSFTSGHGVREGGSYFPVVDAGDRTRIGVALYDDYAGAGDAALR